MSPLINSAIFVTDSFTFSFLFVFRTSIIFVFNSFSFFKIQSSFCFVFVVFYMNHYCLHFFRFLLQKYVFTLLFTSTEIVSSSRILKQNITLIRPSMLAFNGDSTNARYSSGQWSKK